jgi:RHH-type transcriptional regulator, proline utilization regulon repressor / proline dehydrogenase / delta 1-pyrroline-5-carboxylate dehydrogenase
MIFKDPLPSSTALRDAVRASIRVDEEQCVDDLLDQVTLTKASRERIGQMAVRLVEAVRATQPGQDGLDAFLHEYELSSREGVVLMCLAEALLRIPDSDTRDRLIRDKIGDADWEGHLGRSDSLFVNASTWALMLTGRLVRLDTDDRDLPGFIGRLAARSGEPVVREAMVQAMRIMGRQFVMGRTISEALERAVPEEAAGYRHSFDMLGESARTTADAIRYFESYAAAIDAIGEASAGRGPVEGPGISVKLSALHPRFEFAQRDRVMGELAPRLQELALMAKRADIGLTVDAEEADRLDLSLDVVAALSADPALRDWDGLGLAVQAYQKRAVPVLDWLADLAKSHRRRLMVRLVKGAYWDTEIKHCQETGLDDYPVFTRKSATDVSYLACVGVLARDRTAFFPQFATHNANSVAAILEIMGKRTDYEFQRLYGMGEELYAQVVGPAAMDKPCRIYAPVGGHKDLLAYLVRRLLENGANTSFVNRIVDEKLPVEEIVADPVDVTHRLETHRHPGIPLPGDLYGPERSNSNGFDLTDPQELSALSGDLIPFADTQWAAWPLTGTGSGADEGAGTVRHEPADRRNVVGRVTDAAADCIDAAFTAAVAAHPVWSASAAEDRAVMLDRASELFELHEPELMALCIREAGKTLPDAVAEIREAVDFLRYYAARARADFSTPEILPGPTGEHNAISLHGRGVFVCISPWNFPMAIFTGQVAAALAAGNCVLAKPAEQTPLIAFRVVQLLHEAGIPENVLHYLPGDGPQVGAPLVADPRVAGVAFTGSSEVAQSINRTLAAKDGPIVPLIAETGGQNAMIVDSSALPEQVVGDVLTSAFQSSGQRCSALRVLYLQDDIADRVIEMLTGAMDELRIGDPAFLNTDVGPVIDNDAKMQLDAHAARLSEEAQLIHRVDLPDETRHGSFVAPTAFEIDGIGYLEKEVFGPILHVVRFKSDQLDAVLDDINATGYGLTVSVHTRIDDTAEHICSRLRVGNAYINRNQIGAVVGVQPFGGEGLSGTGPKAGGPRYLHRFATERTVSIDTTASGGNTALLNLDDASEE